MLHKCKSHLMLPSEARRFFSSAIRYFFTTCPSDNYLFYKNSVPKNVFQKYSTPPPLDNWMVFLQFTPCTCVLYITEKTLVWLSDIGFIIMFVIHRLFCIRPCLHRFICQCLIIDTVAFGAWQKYLHRVENMLLTHWFSSLYIVNI